MSIGLVLRHTYQETCEICEQIAHYLKVVGSKLDIFLPELDMQEQHLNSQGWEDMMKQKHL